LYNVITAKQGSKLNSLAPLKIKLTLEGGTRLEYKIVTKSQFTIIGRSRKFNTETSYGEIPAGTWAVFPCKGALPKSLQDVNTQIWSEWLPSCKSY
jgi:AraC family transcriptional regulator